MFITMKNRKRAAKKSVAEAVTTDTEAALSWLMRLDETMVRDKILEHLFKKMQRAGDILWYNNIHGRNDKGVDFLIVTENVLGSRVLGIQVKSQKITRSSDSSESSAVRIISECEAATHHTFDLNNGSGKIDNIELWCSAHITEDAEKEFRAPGISISIRIKKADEIIKLLETYCPDILSNVPELSLSMYVRKKREPISKSLRLLGAAINAKTHFIEPLLSRFPKYSPKVFESRKNQVKRVETKISLKDVLDSRQHFVIVAGDLSGKTFLLERIEYLLAENNAIPVFLAAETFGSEKVGGIQKYIAKATGCLTVSEVDTVGLSRPFTLLVDDFHKLTKEQQSSLLGLDASKFRVIASSTGWLGGDAQVAYMVGIDQSCIPKFLRSIDSHLGEKSFTDRAHAFINRTISSSGLQLTPFTVAVMLEECKSGSGRFSTPTMGRLVERFIEVQLGGHNDYEYKVDFETKREFLVKIAGSRKRMTTVQALRERLAKFINKKSHPHSLDTFYDDLINSGVFELREEKIYWAHPVILEYFWVRNLTIKNKLAPIVNILKHGANSTLAAIAGSQIRNGNELLEELCNELEKLKAPTPSTIIDSVRGETFLTKWAEGEGEEELLAEIEKEDSGEEKSGADRGRSNVSLTARALQKSLDFEKGEQEGDASDGNMSAESSSSQVAQLPKEERDAMVKNLNEIFQMISDGRFYLASNVSAVLLNARDTDADEKEKAINAVLTSIGRLGACLSKIVEILRPSDRRLQFLSEWTRIYFQLQFADRVIGDPFLVESFKRLIRSKKNNIEVLTLMDLLVSCGEENYDEIVSTLKKMDRIEITFSLYIRMLALYYYRYHKEKERRDLRNFISRLRLIHKGMNLPLPS